jgi:SNF2 family DNA or RNA helicase
MFHPDLYEFQAEDCERIAQSDKDHHLIANEMGTGKTYEAIALDIYRRRQTDYTNAPTLVIAPLTTLGGWRKHFEDLSDLKPCVIDSKNRSKFLDDLMDYQSDVYILHWEVLRLIPELTKVGWHHIIADEIHKAKNRKAKQTKALKLIKGKYKLGLSGTPVINRPDELWSILHWMYPKDYRSYWRFYNSYMLYEIGYPHGYHIIKGTKNIDELREEIAPITTRRLKKNVLKDLPDKYYTEVSVKLTGVQRKAYDQMKNEMIAWVGENEDQVIVAPVVIAKLVRLQQFSLAYAEIDEDGVVTLKRPSAKLDALGDIIASTDEKIVVFTQFVKMVDLVLETFSSKINMSSITGQTRHREEVIEEFQEGSTQVLVCSIGAGGVGITLTASNKVVFLDRSWSPATNLQAEDRLHRIGQINAVQVIDIMAENTVDLGRMQRLGQKWKWIRQILDQ